YRTPAGMYRRVEEAWHLRTDDHGALAPVRLATLDGGRSPRLTGAQRLPVPPVLAGDGGRGSRPLIHNPQGYAVLAATLGISPTELEEEIAARIEFLAGLAERGVCGPADVAVALIDYPNLPSRASEGATA
ncbi:MAG TPA: hypothetical protein VFH90_00100, partial [Candidatus Limnocylindria bacterium]|nr:hypothetical protein [Candidatus Limnocylindria bacterium]